MPLYEYECECGSRADRFIAMAKRDTPLKCECGGAMKRVMSTPAFKIKNAPMSKREGAKRYNLPSEPTHIVPYSGKHLKLKGPKSSYRRQIYNEYVKHKPNLKYNDVTMED
jgi:putative FmdB family regulatory protein